MLKRVLLVPTCLLLLGSLTNLCYSATVLKFDTPEMTRRATKIVHGRITAISSHVLPKSGQIYTKYELQVIEAWKGLESSKAEDKAQDSSTQGSESTKESSSEAPADSKSSSSDNPEGATKSQSKTISFKQLGGVVNGRGYYIAGSASYKTGEEVVVFLDKPNSVNGCCFTIGLAQGKYRVKYEEGTKTKLVTRQLDKLDFVDGKSRRPVGQPNNSKLALKTLKSQVMTALSQERKN